MNNAIKEIALEAGYAAPEIATRMQDFADRLVKAMLFEIALKKTFYLAQSEETKGEVSDSYFDMAAGCHNVYRHLESVFRS